METTEGRYDFYKRAFKGGALEQTQQIQSEQINQAQSEQAPIEQVQDQTQSVQQMEGQEQVPKTKVNFKISNMIGNLDQTLGSKQKINIDSMFVKQLFGIN